MWPFPDRGRNALTMSVPPRAGDFLGLCDGTAGGPRTADRSLPSTDVLHPAPTSTLINQGVGAVRPVPGAAPDMGSFEHGAAIGTAPESPAISPSKTAQTSSRYATSPARHQDSTPDESVAGAPSAPHILNGTAGASLAAMVAVALLLCFVGMSVARRAFAHAKTVQTRRVVARSLILNVLAWSCVALIAYLSLIPDDMEVRTTMPPGLEHAIAYAGTTSLMMLAYPTRSVWLVVISLMAYSGVMEFLQMFSHGRHPCLDGAAWSSAGALVAGPSIQLYRTWRKSKTSRSKHLPE